ncbi:hypothetical protein [Actinomadura rubrisoli]|uniref:Uncharacterized protein n=1 Tax=Actinomadura rubrisoli TaxID=2530368 RepID=A0A4R5CC99_9ACTN|nr:hypothetical protein [Actinomadura rubrisoli]TDD97608.1 hypothetical protein E1298_00835 [Actinomadura rubrisoli]
MPDTARRVNVSLTFATDVLPHHALMRVTACLPDEYSVRLESTSVHAFDLAEDDADEPCVQLVVDATAGLLKAYVDNPQRAEEFATHTGAVVDELPITADHRGEATA